MPYDEKLADRVREVLGRRRGVTTGRPLTGMVYVGPRGHQRASSLEAWVEQGVSFARSLPPK